MLRLEGRLAGPWVDEVRAASVAAPAGDGRLVLDLTDVSFVDRDGVALLRELAAAGSTLTNCSPFVLDQLSTMPE